MTLRVMFDSNAYDDILRHGDVERIEAAINTGRISSVTTHIQKDELLQTPDEAKRIALIDAYRRVNPTAVPTSASLWGISKWGQAKWTGEEEKTSLSAIQRNKPVISRDELIGTTAKDHCDAFITADKGLAARLSAATPRLRVLTYSDFRTEFLA